jgi:hypothetical protein
VEKLNMSHNPNRFKRRQDCRRLIVVRASRLLDAAETERTTISSGDAFEFC